MNESPLRTAKKYMSLMQLLARAFPVLEIQSLPPPQLPQVLTVSIHVLGE